MSQYLNAMFNFMNIVLLTYFVCLSYCDTRGFEVLFFNDSAIEIIENFNSNSSLNDHEQANTRNRTVLHDNDNFKMSQNDHVQFSSDVEPCSENLECKPHYSCCAFSDRQKRCINNDGEQCGGYYGQECNDTSNPCEIHFNLLCLRDLRTSYEYKCQCEGTVIHNIENGSCENPKNDSGSAMQIYKITMIFASCCLALILIIFLVCILRKSYCVPRRQVVPLDNSTIPDIFTLFPHVGNYDGGPLADGTLPPFEKPPTYDETLTLIRNEIGIPPPAYSGGNTPNSSSQSSPSMSTRVLITNPTLFTVSNETNGRTNSGINSSSDESLAGPSGSGSTSSHQGIDNPAFC